MGAAEFAMGGEEARLSIVGGVDDDRPGARVGVAGVEPVQTLRGAMLASIALGDPERALGARRGAGDVGEGIETAVMVRV